MIGLRDRFPEAASLPLVQAGIMVRDGRSTEAATTLALAADAGAVGGGGLDAEAPLAATLMRAQLANTSGDLQQVAQDSYEIWRLLVL